LIATFLKTDLLNWHISTLDYMFFIYGWRDN